jgi:hypothetical protein
LWAVPSAAQTVDEIEFSDFREVDGVQIPYVTKSTNPVQTMTSTVSDVKHNVAIEDSSFAKAVAQ